MASPVTFDPDAAAAEDAGIFGLPHSPENAQVILIPVPWDVTTSYRPGTSRGPEAIWEASKQVDLYDIETGRPYIGGIAMLPIPGELVALNAEARHLAEPIIDAGGDLTERSDLTAALAEVNQLCVRMNSWVRSETEKWLALDRVVGIIGGDHSTPFGAIDAVAVKHPGVGVLHVDAHADLRKAYEGFTWSHASIMDNVMSRIPGVSKLVQVGIRDVGEREINAIQASHGRIATFFDSDLQARKFAGEPWGHLAAEIISTLPQEVYISFDIDGLEPSQCPNTGTPVPGGLWFAEAVHLIGEVARSGRKIVGFDLNEVAPNANNENDEWDANVGARLLYKLIGWTLRSRQ